MMNSKNISLIHHSPFTIYHLPLNYCLLFSIVLGLSFGVPSVADFKNPPKSKIAAMMIKAPKLIKAHRPPRKAFAVSSLTMRSSPSTLITSFDIRKFLLTITLSAFTAKINFACEKSAKKNHKFL